MKITLDIQESRFKTFLAFIKTLDYVSLPKTSIGDNTIPQWQIDENERRLEDYRKNPKQALDFDQAMDDIEKDL